MDDDPVARRVLEVDDRRQRVVVDDHRLDRVARRVAALGQDDGDDLADVVHLAAGEREVRRVVHVVGDRPRARQRRGPLVVEVGAGAAPPARLAGRAPREASTVMRAWAMRAAHQAHPERAGDGEVVDELGLAGEQLGVLLADAARAEDSTRSAALRWRSRRASAPAPAITALTMLW